jgi:Caspase domain
MHKADPHKSSFSICMISLATLIALFSLTPKKFVATAQVNNGRRLLQVQTLPTKTKRFALLIGVDEYQDQQINRLSGASNDAKALEDALVRYAGFLREQVILLASDQPVDRQPTRANIIRRLSNLRKAVPEDGLLLVSFAGHGIERKGKAYLLPMDAQINSDIDLVEDSSISVETMRDKIRETGVKQIVMILDACRNNPATGRGSLHNTLTPSYVNGFNFNLRNQKVIAFVTLYAAAIGQTAYEYRYRKQGYFTWALCEGLKGMAANKEGEVTLGLLVKYVQARVAEQVRVDLGKEQIPWAEIQGYQANELVLAVVEQTKPASMTGLQPKAPVPVENNFPKPAARALVDKALDEVVATPKGSMGSFWVETPNAGSVWRKLRDQLHGDEIPELCQILGEAHEWLVYWKAIRLLSYSSQQAEGIPLNSQILSAFCDHVDEGGYIQDEALKLIQKLHVPAAEIWKCLFDSLQIVSDRDADDIVKVIVQFTPPDQRENTGLVVLNKFIYWVGDYGPYNLIRALEALDYRKGIPALRGVFSRNDHQKVINAAELLAKWGDKESIPLMRQFINDVHKRPGVSAHLNVLRSLYTLEGSACADYVAGILLQSSPNSQRYMLFVLDDFKNEPAVINALHKLVETTSDPDVKKNIGEFLKRIEKAP